METATLKYNELPVITFRWVRANDLKLERILPEELEYKGDYVRSGARHILPFQGVSLPDYLCGYTGTNEEELSLLLEQARVKHHIRSGEDGEMVRLSYDLSDENGALLEINAIEVRENERLDVLLEYRGGEAARFASTLNLIRVAPGGVLNLYKINHLPHHTRHIEQRYARVEEGGRVNYVSVELGAKESIIHYLTDLSGEEAQGSLQSIYIGHEDRLLDLSHQMSHFGKKCRSNMEIRGALTGRARKYFRGTLDFKKGSAQSEGGEVETVMLLNKDVRSFAIPLLLCGEHDVIGNHAASAGQIDEENLFYLMSRGFSEEDSKRILVESAFRPIIDRLPDEILKQEVLKRVDSMMKKVNRVEL